MRSGDIALTPIVSAPVGVIGGLFMGAEGYFNEMVGKYPDTGFLSSYHKYFAIKNDDDRFESAFNLGSHIGR